MEKDFTDKTSKAQQIKANIDKLKCTKLKSTTKEMIRIKRLATEWEIIFEICESAMGLMGKYISNLKIQ
jgi:hypothetical protein